ncbi:hypothetical protein Q8F55_008174 [Vanrija albida]|uniref:Uncharacterized protein n=1 Tax=Vanrija albida TaxID=181172 RepID=A0ABR3PVP0_9TREE
MGYALYTAHYPAGRHARSPSLTAASLRRSRDTRWGAGLLETLRESVYPFLGAEERRRLSVSASRADGLLAAPVPALIRTKADAVRCLRAFTGPRFHPWVAGAARKANLRYPALVVLSYVDIKIRAGKSRAGVRAKLERIEIELPGYYQVYGMVRDLRRLGPSRKLDVPWPPRYDEHAAAARAAMEFDPPARLSANMVRREVMWWEARDLGAGAGAR